MSNISELLNNIKEFVDCKHSTNLISSNEFISSYNNDDYYDEDVQQYETEHIYEMPNEEYYGVKILISYSPYMYEEENRKQTSYDEMIQIIKKILPFESTIGFKLYLNYYQYWRVGIDEFVNRCDQSYDVPKYKDMISFCLLVTCT